jgi:hypothetical protein
MKINTLQPKQKDREASFWYKGDIAILGNYKLIAVGDIRVNFQELQDDVWYKDEQAVDKALELGYFDEDLKDLEFGNNNWFEVIKVDKSGNMIDCDVGVVEFDYTSAIELLKNYYSNNGSNTYNWYIGLLLCMGTIMLMLGIWLNRF